MFQFRKSTLQDMDQIVRIAEEGRALLKSRGISQWQTGSYPDRPLFEQDVQEGIGYVVCEEGRVAAICALQITPEEDYRHLTEGRWLTGEGTFYAAVHRAAVAPECQGRHVTTFLFDSAAKPQRGWERPAFGRIPIRTISRCRNPWSGPGLKNAASL